MGSDGTTDRYGWNQWEVHDEPGFRTSWFNYMYDNQSATKSTFMKYMLLILQPGVFGLHSLSAQTVSNTVRLRLFTAPLS